jgi:hypothetical protein
MTGQAGLLELSAGSALLLGGREWTVAAIEPQYGRVLLRSGGEERWRSIRWLAHHPDCRPVPDDDAVVPARPAGQPPVLDDLTGYQREVVRMRVAHLLEAETGFRGGDPLRPEPGEPRPGYHPRSTTLGQRRRAKAAELKALGGEEAALLGLGKASERTLERMAAAWKDRGPAGCIDGRWVRAGGGHPSITEEVREAIFAVRRETRTRSRTSMMDKYILVCQYVAEKHGAGVPVPGFWTLREVWREWFGPGGTRPRYDRSADGIEASKVHVTVHRPGQVIALDTTPLPVKVRDGVFGEPVSVMLTLALDMFTHAAVAFRLTLVSDTAVDIAMLLRDVMMPLPMRDGWGPEMEWPYPGVPVGEQQPGDALAFSCRGGGVVPDAGQVGGQLLYPGLLGAGELPGVFLAGSVAGFLGLAEGAEGGVPVGFEGVGDEPVGGVDGQVAAAGQVSVILGAFRVGGAQRVRFGGPVLKLGGHLQGGFDGERGEGVDEQLPDGLVQVLAGDRSAGRASVLDAVALAHGGLPVAGCGRAGGSGRSCAARSGRR